MEAGHVLEKQGLQPLLAPSARERLETKPSSKSSLRRWTRLASTWGLAAAGLWTLASSARRLRTPLADKDFGWADIVPSRALQWHACRDGEFECARLDVPMDWVEPSDEQRVILAVIRLPAKTREDYRGPVFVNPGGPGGSGVDFLVRHGKEMQTIVGDNHDMISFDPRGVSASVPRIDCWGSSHTRHDWDRGAIEVLDAHPGLVYEAFAAADAFSRQCEAHLSAAAPGLLEHVSTASHARDMLAIAEAAGQARLRYWGVSYGTILGGTFAAMFPDRVERLVSDGNVDYASWYRLDQRNFFEDTDSIMEAFFYYCHKAGPDRCAFYRPASPAAIEERFFALLARLRERPVRIPARAADDAARGLPILPRLVTYAELQLLVRTVLYKPLYEFPALAAALAALEDGDGRPFYAMAGDDEPEGGEPFCSPRDASSPMDADSPDANFKDAFTAITCSDGDAPADTPASFAAYAAELQGISRYAGAAYANFRGGCVGRQIRPRYRFAAPWPPGPAAERNTSFPILFIGNTGDNVTPLSSARRNAAAFPGSVVLVQKTWGHASLAAPSSCTARAIRAYFQDGRLPAHDTHCEQDYELFGEAKPEVNAEGEDEGADDISRAVRKLTREVSLARGRHHLV